MSLCKNGNLSTSSSLLLILSSLQFYHMVISKCQDVIQYTIRLNIDAMHRHSMQLFCLIYIPGYGRVKLYRAVSAVKICRQKVELAFKN